MHSVHFKKLPKRSPRKGNVLFFRKKITNRLLVSLYEGLTFRAVTEKVSMTPAPMALNSRAACAMHPNCSRLHTSNHQSIQHMYVMDHVTDWRIRQQNSPHCVSHSPPAQMHAISGQVLCQMKGRLS